MTVYNKLVRDKIPQIIADGGERCYTRRVSGEEYRKLLEAKLDEEAGEFHREKNLEELADILEVVYALAETIGSRAELEEVYSRKHELRGGFAEGIFLIGKE